jgi:hypothetical protein
VSVAALRSLRTDRSAELPFRPQSVAPSLVVVLLVELAGFAAIAYLIARLL